VTDPTTQEIEAAARALYYAEAGLHPTFSWEDAPRHASSFGMGKDRCIELATAALAAAAAVRSKPELRELVRLIDAMWLDTELGRVHSQAEAVRAFNFFVKHAADIAAAVRSGPPESVAAGWEEAKRLNRGIKAFLDGDYPHPRACRPLPCKHGVEYYNECGQCDVEYFVALLAAAPPSEPHDPDDT
jgi:hypothetical protein